jgi:hypothetical protein
MQTLVVGDGKNSIAVPMFMLPPKPIYQAKTYSGPSLYLITLVDYRYYWPSISWTGAANRFGTWEELFASIALPLGVELKIDPISEDYGRPDMSMLSLPFRNIAFVLDAAAASVGQKIVHSLDGTYRSISAKNSYELHNKNLNIELVEKKAHRLFGFEQFLNVFRKDWNSDLNRLLPTRVRVIFGKTVKGGELANKRELPGVYYYAHTIREAFDGDGSAVAGQLITLNGNEGTKNIWTTANAIYQDMGHMAGDPLNKAEVIKLAKKISQDYYLYQLGRAEARYAAIVKWEPEGHSEWIEWEHESQRISTRIYRGPYYDRLEDLHHYLLPAPPCGVCTFTWDGEKWYASDKKCVSRVDPNTGIPTECFCVPPKSSGTYLNETASSECGAYACGFCTYKWSSSGWIFEKDSCTKFISSSDKTERTCACSRPLRAGTYLGEMADTGCSATATCGTCVFSWNGSGWNLKRDGCVVPPVGVTTTAGPGVTTTSTTLGPRCSCAIPTTTGTLLNEEIDTNCTLSACGTCHFQWKSNKWSVLKDFCTKLNAGQPNEAACICNPPSAIGSWEGEVRISNCETTTSGPCKGLCRWEWNDSTKVWKVTDNGCEANTLCMCVYPTFCGTFSCERTKTYCAKGSGTPPTCSGTTTTSTTTSKPIGCLGGCVWVYFGKQFGWHLKASDCCDEAWSTDNEWVRRCKYRFLPDGRACGCSMPPDGIFDNWICGTVKTTTCVVDPEKGTEGPYCYGTCPWYFTPEGFWICGYKDELKCSSCYSDQCCYKNKVSCSCPMPSWPGIPCTWGETRCVSPDDTSLPPRTTVPPTGCFGQCKWKWTGLAWAFETSNCPAGSCGCYIVPAGNGTTTCDTEVTPCSPKTTTTTSTTTTSTTTTTSCPTTTLPAETCGGRCRFQWVVGTPPNVGYWKLDQDVCLGGSNCTCNKEPLMQIAGDLACNRYKWTACIDNCTTTTCPPTTLPPCLQYGNCPCGIFTFITDPGGSVLGCPTWQWIPRYNDCRPGAIIPDPPVCTPQRNGITSWVECYCTTTTTVGPSNYYCTEVLGFGYSDSPNPPPTAPGCGQVGYRNCSEWTNNPSIGDKRVVYCGSGPDDFRTEKCLSTGYTFQQFLNGVCTNDCFAITTTTTTSTTTTTTTTTTPPLNCGFCRFVWVINPFRKWELYSNQCYSAIDIPCMCFAPGYDGAAEGDTQKVYCEFINTTTTTSTTTTYAPKPSCGVCTWTCIRNTQMWQLYANKCTSIPSAFNAKCECVYPTGPCSNALIPINQDHYDIDLDCALPRASITETTTTTTTTTAAPEYWCWNGACTTTYHAGASGPYASLAACQADPGCSLGP